MDPDDSKNAELTPPVPQAAQPEGPASELAFSEAELREMSASLDLEVISLLNPC